MGLAGRGILSPARNVGPLMGNFRTAAIIYWTFLTESEGFLLINLVKRRFLYNFRLFTSFVHQAYYLPVIYTNLFVSVNRADFSAYTDLIPTVRHVLEWQHFLLLCTMYVDIGSNP